MGEGTTGASKVNEYYARHLVQIALHPPDLRRLSAEPAAQRELDSWKADLRRYMELIAGQAWSDGATWAMGRVSEAKYLIVTQEQYDQLRRDEVMKVELRDDLD